MCDKNLQRTRNLTWNRTSTRLCGTSLKPDADPRPQTLKTGHRTCNSASAEPSPQTHFHETL